MELPAHQFAMTALVTPVMVNSAGNGHCGTVLNFLDQAADAAPAAVRGRHVVTLAVVLAPAPE